MYQLLGVDDDVEVYFASFRNAVFTTPFFVLADHQTKSIVIAIRGIFSSLFPHYVRLIYFLLL